MNQCRCAGLSRPGRTPPRTATQAVLSIFNGSMVIIKIRTSVRETGLRNDKERRNVK
jgi:hypothetical protein